MPRVRVKVYERLFYGKRNLETQPAGVHVARVEVAQLSLVFQRANRLAGRQLDDQHRDGVAGLSPDQFGSDAGRRRIRQSGSVAFDGAVRRSADRAARAAPSTRGDANAGDDSIAGAGGAGAQRAHRHLGDSGAGRDSGFHQRLRYAGAAGAGGRNGRRQSRFVERYRAQFFDGQRLAAGRAGAGGRHYRGVRRRLVLFCSTVSVILR